MTPPSAVVRAKALAAQHWAGLSLAALVVAGVVVRLVLVEGIKAPVVLCDEFIYANIARNLADHGRYLFRGEPIRQSYLYPLMLAPAWFWHSMSTTYALAKAVTATSMTLVAIPVYLWGRRLVKPIYALLGAALALLLPAFFYSGILMTEGVFLPTFVLAVYAIAVALERTTLLSQVAAFAAILLAVSVRFQGVVLFLVIPTAAVVKLLLDRQAGDGRDRLLAWARRLWPTGVLLAGGFIVYALYQLSRGAPLAGGLGAYETLGQTHYPLGPTAHWSIKLLAELGLAVGFAPMSALIVLLWLALRRRPTTEAERVFLAVVPAAMLWILVEVGAFAASVTPFVFERYTFCLEPLLLLAFVVWLGRGMPRPLVGTAVAVATPLLLLLPLDLQTAIVPDAVNGVTVASLHAFSKHLPGGLQELRWAIVAGGLLAAFLFALCTRSIARIALTTLLALYLAAAFRVTFNDIRSASLTTRAAAGSDPTWVVGAVGKDRKAVYVNTPTTGVAPSNVLLETEFWNPNVTSVYSVGASEICPLHETPTVTDVGTGRISPPLPQGVDLAVVAREVPFSGQRVAEGGPADERLVLYRVGKKLRVGAITSGVSGDGWMGEEATYSRFVVPGHRPGRLTLTLGRPGWGGPDVPGKVRIAVGRPSASGSGLSKVLAVRYWTVHRLTQRTFVFNVPPPPVRVDVLVRPTFSPAQFAGYSDTRQLGAQVSFSFRPR